MLNRDVSVRTLYSTDNSIYQVQPAAVATPHSTAEVMSVLADNAQQTRPQPILARGAGTGTNGQSLGAGITIDLKRHLNQLISLDVDNAEVVVQPGMVAGKLNQLLASHGLFWAPHASTMNRATVGGMISTDAAGKGSLRYGRTSRHVVALDVVLDDGTPWQARAIPVREAQTLAQNNDRIGRLWRDLLRIELPGAHQLGLPELARGFSGYGIDRLYPQSDGEPFIDPVPLLVGSEGTLAVITAATLRLTPKPARTVLVVASYRNLPEAIEDAIELRATEPTAIECFDETTLERGRSSPAWPAIQAAVGEHGGALLLIEYAAEVAGLESHGTAPLEEALSAAERTLSTRGQATGWVAVTDPTVQAAAWKVRADAVGLIAKVTTSRPGYTARPVAFVEDCAVPVAAMPQFIAAFRDLLDTVGVPYAMFGHADVGCVHVRPALDLTDEADRARVAAITGQVVTLVDRFGGLLWGEHGRGFRGSYVETFLPSETITVMRAVKEAFDPHDRLNPGKLYRPLSSTAPVLTVTDPPLRADYDRQVPVSVRTEHRHAFACNGNGLCHHFDAAEVMCPSFKATGDPSLSPKGRAELMRAWLHSSATGDTDRYAALGEALYTSFDQCLSCSACTGHCPIEVDIPELKSQFLSRYHDDGIRRPIDQWVMGRFESLASTATRFPPRLLRVGVPLMGRLTGLSDLPIPAPPITTSALPRVSRRQLRRIARGRPGNLPDLVLLPDLFSFTLEPAVTLAAFEVLTQVGYQVAIGPFVPTAKYAHVKGQRRAFQRAAEAQAKLLVLLRQVGVTPVVVEPAVRLLFGHEYSQILPDFPGDAVRSVAQMIEPRIEHLPTMGSDTTSDSRNQNQRVAAPKMRLLRHCTEGATDPDEIQRWSRILSHVGFDVSCPPVGCCGMAGVFGHERRNHDLSKAIFDLSWDQHLAQARDGGELVAASGYSCRSQARRFGSPPSGGLSDVHHPLAYLDSRGQNLWR